MDMDQTLSDNNNNVYESILKRFKYPGGTKKAAINEIKQRFKETGEVLHLCMRQYYEDVHKKAKKIRKREKGENAEEDKDTVKNDENITDKGEITKLESPKAKKLRYLFASLTGDEVIYVSNHRNMNLHEVPTEFVSVKPFFKVICDYTMHNPQYMYSIEDDIIERTVECILEKYNACYGPQHGYMTRFDICYMNQCHELDSATKLYRMQYMFILNVRDFQTNKLVAFNSILDMKAWIYALGMLDVELPHDAYFDITGYNPESPLFLPRQSTYVRLNGKETTQEYINLDACDVMRNHMVAVHDAKDWGLICTDKNDITVLDASKLDKVLYDCIISTLPSAWKLDLKASGLCASTTRTLPDLTEKDMDMYNMRTLLIDIIGNDGQMDIYNEKSRDMTRVFLATLKRSFVSRDLVLEWLKLSPDPEQTLPTYIERIMRFYDSINVSVRKIVGYDFTFLERVVFMMYPSLESETWVKLKEIYTGMRIKNLNRLTLPKEKRYEELNVVTIESTGEYFPDMTQYMDDSTCRTFFLKGSMGKGKTHQVKNKIRTLQTRLGRLPRVLVPTPRRSFATFIYGELKSILGSANVRHYSDNSENAPSWNTSSIVVQLESLAKIDYYIIDREPFDIIIIDECTALLSEFMSKTMDGRVGDSLHTLRWHLSHSMYNIIACADLSDISIEIMQSMVKECTYTYPRALLVHHKEPPQRRTALLIAKDEGYGKTSENDPDLQNDDDNEKMDNNNDESVNVQNKKYKERAWKVMLRQIIGYFNSNPGCKVYYPCTSHKVAKKTIQEVVANTDLTEDECLLICKNTMNKVLKSNFTELIQDKRFVVATSAFSVGIDINKDTNGNMICFDKMFLYGSACTCPVREAMQLTRRIRNIVDPVIEVAYDARKSLTEPDCYDIDSYKASMLSQFKGSDLCYSGKENPGNDAMLISAQYQMEATLNRNHYELVLYDALQLNNIEIVEAFDEYQPILTRKDMRQLMEDTKDWVLPDLSMDYTVLDQYVVMPQKKLMEMLKSEDTNDVHMAQWAMLRINFDKVFKSADVLEKRKYWESEVRTKPTLVDELLKKLRHMVLEKYSEMFPLERVYLDYIKQDDIFHNGTKGQLEEVINLARSLGLQNFSIPMTIPRKNITAVAESLCNRKRHYARIYGFSFKKSDSITDKGAIGTINSILSKWSIFKLKSSSGLGTRARKVVDGKLQELGNDELVPAMDLTPDLVDAFMTTANDIVSREIKRLEQIEEGRVFIETEVKRGYRKYRQDELRALTDDPTISTYAFVSSGESDQDKGNTTDDD